MNIGLIVLNVSSAATLKMAKAYVKAHRCKMYTHDCLPPLGQKTYHRLGGIRSRSLQVAASYVWKFDRIIYLTTADRFKDMLEAIEVAARVGKDYEVYVYADTDYDLSKLAQVTLERN